MGRDHTDDKVRNQKVDYQQVYVSNEDDFASVKLAPGIEARSYLKNGLMISEDENGNIIEIQILNLSKFRGSIPHAG